MTRLDALRSALAAVSLAAVVGTGCVAPVKPSGSTPPPPVRVVEPPPPDADGSPDRATLLALGAQHGDSLDRAARDLDDWFRIVLPRAGTLRLSLVGANGASLPHVFVSLTDERGLAAAQAVRAGGRSRVDLPAQQVAAGTRLVWVGTEPESNAPVAYQIRAEFTPKPEQKRVPPPLPPPPAPRYQVFATHLVELAGGESGQREATIAGGRDAGLSVGMRGRLVDAGRVLAAFEVVEVFAKGSRVRIEGKLEGRVSAAATAEVDVPVR